MRLHFLIFLTSLSVFRALSSYVVHAFLSAIVLICLIYMSFSEKLYFKIISIDSGKSKSFYGNRPVHSSRLFSMTVTIQFLTE